MPIFNGEKYIEASIQSVLNQTFRNFELIIVDDKSLDNSLKIAETYAGKDNRITIIENATNLGLTKSLNKAIKKSKGEYIARLDVDDISLPERIEKQLSFLEKNPEYAFCGTDVLIKQLRKFSVQHLNYLDIKKNLIINNLFAHSSILIRKQCLEKYGLYDEKYLYGQDYELWCRLVYKYQLKTKVLADKLIILHVPNEKLSEKNKKFLIQHKNYIKNKLRYVKYVQEPLIIIRSLLSIVRNSLEILYVLFFLTIKRKKI